MSNATHAIPELDRSGLRQFGITTGIIVAVLFGVFFPWLLEAGFVLWPWVLCGLLALMGLVAPMSLRPVYKIWMRFGLMMSRFPTPLIMGSLPSIFIMSATGVITRKNTSPMISGVVKRLIIRPNRIQIL